MFRFATAGESNPGAAARDFINGFVHGSDRIDLSGVDANNLTGANEAFTFIGSAAFTGAGSASAGQLRFFTFGGGNLNIVEADRDGNGTADMQIFVNPDEFHDRVGFRAVVRPARRRPGPCRAGPPERPVPG